ncbi:MAG: hypothetical protein GX045_06125 [Clostridiaceae bacterium]|jgi:uroporphyrinogen decarboxylase|nr:hypothetical protein [Clostridiaceae bacterium]
MTPKQRLLSAINRQIPDRLPVTTHHVMPYFLDKYMKGINNDGFFAEMGLDPVVWTNPYKPDKKKGQFGIEPGKETDIFGLRKISSENWRITEQELSDPKYKTTRFTIHTPKGALSTVLQANDYTIWVLEHLIKEKKDIELIAEYANTPLCDVESVNETAEKYGDNALIRGHICILDIFGQPGCWQDAACLFGIEKLIYETYDDPEWVHEFLGILRDKKLNYVKSLKGARYDILELGGGDASSTVISPAIFNEFVAPYDSVLITAAHEAGQKIVYHTCGGMMAILEDIAAMNPDAMETFTPSGMGGDASLKEAKRRIGDKVCMIGGFDQLHFFQNCDPEETRAEVRRCFEEAGGNGGYILSPSDHFFDADLKLIKAMADEAKNCVY